MRVQEFLGERRTFRHRRHGRLWRKREGLRAKEDIRRHRPACQRRTGASPLSKYLSTTRLRIRSLRHKRLRRRRSVGRSLRLRGLRVRRLRRKHLWRRPNLRNRRSTIAGRRRHVCLRHRRLRL
ncbi:hypothetical protein Mp_1g04660 [Marchantia polymorpha subsp. ruderalis]|uniref:Uncharacterized protein n=2 Tax=Marchantia polymorpha TaxID=3197 RepID=A0AAF6ALI6_MARPO|nr:hypothetical protein MARPO_0005s0141 [Marchantia polymorpha]BBM97306.1 hypothetical protein Mp_1g04660 [Marchantia polymorpha subsp. ruderalis]|eukprot:PTQ48500.1 hypothetical protein MARPO_0005s0141 [Marchantia polymorpha]